MRKHRLVRDGQTPAKPAQANPHNQNTSRLSPEILLQHLEELLAKLDVEVRQASFATEPLSSTRTRGGICRVRKRTIVFVSSHASITERIEVLARAAASFDTEAVFMLPVVRQFIESQRAALLDEASRLQKNS
ncbi:MAG: hypothetical protein FWD57_01835 [Polyangiaceae bacterium]|nr:hypothetical protein [Polyangiaceae bacterium]